MKRVLSIAALVAMTVMSCTKNEAIPSAQSDAIGFDTFLSNATKADASGFDTDDTFYVNAFYTKGANFAGTATPEKFMVSQKVVKGATEWSYSPVKYWPNNSGDMVSFFAVTDATATEYEFVQQTTVDKTKIAFTASDLSKDIMVATLIDKTKDDGQLVFQFKHTTAQMKFNAALKEDLAADTDTGDKTEVKITSLEVSYGDAVSNSGTFTFDPAPAADAPLGSWAMDAVEDGTLAKAATTFADGAEGIGSVLTTSSIAVGDPIMLLPLAANEFTVTMTYQVITTDADKDENSHTMTNVSTFTVKPTAQNTIYTYNMLIGLSKVEVAGTVSDWSTGVLEEDFDVDTNTGTLTAK